MPPPESQCQGKARFIGWCDRKPSVVRDGKQYCWMHDPVRRARVSEEKRQKRLVDIAVRNAELEATWKRQDLERNSGIRNLSDSDLERIIAAGGIHALLPPTDPTP